MTTRTDWMLLVAVMMGTVAIGSSTVYRIMSIFFVTVAIMAGLHLITGLARSISLCHSALVGVGAYAGAITSLRFGAPALVSVLAGAVCAALGAFAIANLTRRFEEHYLAFATLAVSEVLANFFRSATPITGGVNGLTGIPSLAAFDFSFDSPARYFWPAAAFGLMAFALVRLIGNSIAGQALRAYGDEGARAASLGVGTSGLRVFAFAIGSGIAGGAGAVSAHLDGFVGPESFGIGVSIAYLCYLVIGGVRSIRGVFVAATFASLGPELLRGFVAWQMVIVSVLALTVLCVGPEPQLLAKIRAGAWPILARRHDDRTASLKGEQ